MNRRFYFFAGGIGWDFRIRIALPRIGFAAVGDIRRGDSFFIHRPILVLFVDVKFFLIKKGQPHKFPALFQEIDDQLLYT